MAGQILMQILMSKENNFSIFLSMPGWFEKDLSVISIICLGEGFIGIILPY